MRVGISLRDFRQADFDDFAAFFQSERSRFIGGPVTRELAWRGLAAPLGHRALRGYGFRAVEDRAAGQFCGHVGLWFPEGWPEPEVAWVMMGHAEGRGIAREAAEAARDYAFGPLGWTTAISAIDPGIARSIRLAEGMSCRRAGDFTDVRLGRMQIWRHPPSQRG